MSKIRKAAVSGTFYPDNKDHLDQMLDHFLNKAPSLEAKPKAIIVPHAGYIYSGQVAASAYKPLAKIKDSIKRVILIGPSHHSSFDGFALPASEYFETPLGKVKIDQDIIKSLKTDINICISDKIHKDEHSLEVHIPFLQKIFNDSIKITPILVGNCNIDQSSEIIEKLWGNDETLIIISTDLSHYHPYEEAYVTDAKTCKDIEKLEISELDTEKLCGFLPVCGLMQVAKKKKLDINIIDFCNSGDIIIDNKNVEQDDNGVVGYGAFYCATKENLGEIMSKPHKQELLAIAREIIEYSLENNYDTPEFLDSALEFNLDPRATFVTLTMDDKLRGCIGSLEASRDILQDVAFNAYSAAFLDNRFSKLTKNELDDVKISISILNPSENLEFTSEKDLLNKIRPNIDGLILTSGNKRVTFLPSVWNEIKNKQDFINHLKIKAGLQKNFWDNNIKIARYTTNNFDESLF